jgi:hypothetical protein
MEMLLLLLIWSGEETEEINGPLLLLLERVKMLLLLLIWSEDTGEIDGPPLLLLLE